MKTRILITDHLPENVILPLKEKYQMEMNQEDCPLDRQALISKVKDKHGLLSMLNDSINEEVLACAPH
jgi:lactate dehydrogenase-like 2-hydroxyacid dehydrogenase